MSSVDTFDYRHNNSDMEFVKDPQTLSVLSFTFLVLNIEGAIHFIRVAKSKMFWQGVKSIAFGAKRSVVKPYFLLPCNTFYFMQL